MEFSKIVNWQTHTDGSSLWSTHIKTVQIVEVYLNYVDDENQFGELCARFDTSDWDITQVGLIYTDHGWISEFRALMKTLGFGPKAIDDISYSEQGMQGADYVSMDVGQDFLTEVEPMYRWLASKEMANSVLA